MSLKSTKIIRAYRDGKTYEEIGQENSLTRERVRQIIMKGIYYEIQKEKILGEFDTSIEVLDLDKGAFNKLIRNGIFSIEELTKYTPENLLYLPSMGKTNLRKIKKSLEKYGLKLAKEEQIKEIHLNAPKAEDSIKYTPIETLLLTPRTYHALILNGVKSVEQLVLYPLSQIRKFQGMGKKSIEELSKTIEKKGLGFRIKSIKASTNREIPVPVLSDNEYEAYFLRLKKDHRKNWIINHYEDEEKLLKEAQHHNSIHNFAKKTKVTPEIIKEYYPKVYEIIANNHEKLKKRWNKYYLKCRMCETTSVPYMGHGYCKNCYTKSEEYKNVQKESRERNKHKWEKQQKEYYKKYSKRPEVMERVKKRGDIKKYDGNREKAIIRDNYACVECGMTRKESYAKYDGDLCVSRIDGNRKNNELSNLKTLCRHCFRRIGFQHKSL